MLLDVVYNHLGPEGNHLARFGPYFTDHHRTPWGDAVNLDAAGSAEVRRFLIDNARMWLRDYHVDGLRLDAVHALRDDSALHLLEELAAGRRRPRAGAGPAAGADRRERPQRPADGRAPTGRLRASTRSGPMTCTTRIHVALTGERVGYYEDFTGLADVAVALERGFVYDGRLSPVRHRAHGRPLLDFDLGPRPADRIVTCLENHDQVGNRARGERTNHLVGLDRFLAGATLALTAPGVPLLFQGEEWAASAPFQFFADHQDADLVDAVRKGRVEEFAAFGWDPDEVPDPEVGRDLRALQALAGPRSTIPSTSQVLRHYRSLLELRRSHPDLRDGRFVRSVELHPSSEAIAFHRGELVVAANLGRVDRPPRPPAPPAPLPSITVGDVAALGQVVELGPDSALVARVGLVRATFDGAS